MRKSFTILILCLSPAAFAQAGLREAAMALDRAVTKLDLPVIEKLVPLIAAQEDRAAYQLLYSQGLRIGKMLLAAEKDEYQRHVTGLKGGKRQRFGKRYLSMEKLASEQGLDFEALPLDLKEELWQEAKRLVG